MQGDFEVGTVIGGVIGGVVGMLFGLSILWISRDAGICDGWCARDNLVGQVDQWGDNCKCVPPSIKTPRGIRP